MERVEVDGAGWVRVVGDAVNDVGAWATANAAVLLMVAGALLVAWLLFRLVTRP